jgi:pimeloyl-ACP methyl ester carboxylesterase
VLVGVAGLSFLLKAGGGLYWMIPAVLAGLAGVIEALDTAPIIIGHSFGGTVTQLLLARGLGSAGVVIDSAPTEGVHVTPLSQIRSFFPALKNPANIHKAVAFTAEEFHYAFANTLSVEDSNAAWQRYAIAAPGNWVWVYGLIANLKPATRRHGSTMTRTALRCCSSAARRTTSCRPRSTGPMPGTTRTRPRSPSTSSSRAGTTGPAARPDGKPSPTTRSTGPRNTHVRRLAPDGERAQDQASALEASTGR